MNSRRAWLVWTAAVLVYAAAVTHRTSFGVAGLAAAERFNTGATVLSLFVVVQVVMYASLQMPVGVALDRWGSRLVLTIGAVVATIGQVGMALAPDVPLALVARVLIGTGDALTFVSAIRLIPAWFEARQVPVLTQFTGILGQMGQMVSAIPFAWSLLHLGWSTAFWGLAGIGLAATVIASVMIRDRPAGALPPPPQALLHGLGTTLRTPGTWLGFWGHLVTAYSLHLFTLLWGYPFLVDGEGLSESQASGLLVIAVVVAVVSGPVIGILTARYRQHRTALVLGIGMLSLVGWLLVLVPATPAPLWVLVVFVAFIAVGGPGSLVGLDLAASYAPPNRGGSATGVANAGGFVGALVLALVVGVILDHRSANPDLADYQAALWVTVAMWAVGTAGVLLSWVRTQRAARTSLSS